jgi:hypothetical protein
MQPQQNIPLPLLYLQTGELRARFAHELSLAIMLTQAHVSMSLIPGITLSTDSPPASRRRFPPAPTPQASQRLISLIYFPVICIISAPRQTIFTSLTAWNFSSQLLGPLSPLPPLPAFSDSQSVISPHPICGCFFGLIRPVVILRPLSSLHHPFIIYSSSINYYLCPAFIRFCASTISTNSSRTGSAISITSNCHAISACPQPSCYYHPHIYERIQESMTHFL